MNDPVRTIFKDVIALCNQSKLAYWVVGGWAFDGKRGYSSRAHEDVDLCILEKDLETWLRLFFDNKFRVTKEGLKYVVYKNNIKVDIFPLFANKNFYERKREWFQASYPKEMFDNHQTVTLNGITFRIPSNEGLRYYGSKTVHKEDQKFTDSLPYDKDIYDLIQYEEFADYKKSKEAVVVEEINF